MDERENILLQIRSHNNIEVIISSVLLPPVVAVKKSLTIKQCSWTRNFCDDIYSLSISYLLFAEVKLWRFYFCLHEKNGVLWVKQPVKMVSVPLSPLNHQKQNATWNSMMLRSFLFAIYYLYSLSIVYQFWSVFPLQRACFSCIQPYSRKNRVINDLSTMNTTHLKWPFCIQSASWKFLIPFMQKTFQWNEIRFQIEMSFFFRFWVRCMNEFLQIKNRLVEIRMGL